MFGRQILSFTGIFLSFIANKDAWMALGHKKQNELGSRDTAPLRRDLNFFKVID